MPKDKNGKSIKIGDMVKFKEDRYNSALGVVEKFSTISDCVYVKVCGGGGMGNRMVEAATAEVILR